MINVTGCFGIDFLAVLAEERMLLGPGARLFLMVGVIGGYTTFSTFGYETIALLHDGSLGAASLNARLLRLSKDLPVVIETVDTEENVQAFLPALDEMVKEGLATVEKATVIFYGAGPRPPKD